MRSSSPGVAASTFTTKQPLSAAFSAISASKTVLPEPLGPSNSRVKAGVLGPLSTASTALLKLAEMTLPEGSKRFFG